MQPALAFFTPCGRIPAFHFLRTDPRIPFPARGFPRPAFAESAGTQELHFLRADPRDLHSWNRRGRKNFTGPLAAPTAVVGVPLRQRGALGVRHTSPRAVTGLAHLAGLADLADRAALADRKALAELRDPRDPRKLPAVKGGGGSPRLEHEDTCPPGWAQWRSRALGVHIYV
eukprot:gene9798-biopygen9805